MVIAHLVLHPQEDQRCTGNTHRQTRYIEDAETPIFPKVPDRGHQIITEHMAVVFCKRGQWDASFTASSFSSP
jgi:hypothetical protein